MNILTVMNGTVVGFSVVQEGNYNVGMAQVQVPTKRTLQDGTVVSNYIMLRMNRQHDIQQFSAIQGPTLVSFVADHFVIENSNGMVIVKASLLHATLGGAANGESETFVTVTNAKTGTFPVQLKTTNAGKSAVTVSVSSFGESVNNQTVWNSLQLTGFNKQEVDLLTNIAPSTYVTVNVGQCVFSLSPKKGNPMCYGVIRGIEAQEGRNMLKVDPQNGSTTQQNGFGSAPQGNGFGGNGFGSAPQGNGFGGNGFGSAPQGNAPQGNAPQGNVAPNNGFGGNTAQNNAPQNNGFGGNAPQNNASQNNGFGGNAAQNNGFGGNAAQNNGFGNTSQPPMQNNNVGGFPDEDLPF